MDYTSPLKLLKTHSQNGQSHRKFGFSSPKSASVEPPTPGTRNRMVRLRQMWEHGFRNHEVKEEKVPNFELDVPEHLPDSPLCPRNPIHKSGGTGICVYHGRNKKDSWKLRKGGVRDSSVVVNSFKVVDNGKQVLTLERGLLIIQFFVVDNWDLF